MSSPTGSGSWEDRRGLFQRGKEFAEPLSKAQYYKPNSPPNSPTVAEGSTAGRRRSSASSGGMFGNLMQHKRGSEDYSQRRASIDEMATQKGAFGNLIEKLARPTK